MSAIAHIHEAARLWGDGLSVNEIAAKLDLTRGQVLGLSNRNRELFPFRAASASRAAFTPPCVCPTCGLMLKRPLS